MAEPIFAGRCLCGEIRYRVTGTPRVVTHCHCRNCRRSSGAPFLTWAEFRAENFVVTRGTPTSHHDGKEVVRRFCGTCGTQLTYQRQTETEIVDVTVGSMEDPEAVVPTDHIWTCRRVSWIRISDDLPGYDRHRTTRE